MDVLLSLVGVSKRYWRGVREIAVLRDVSFELRRGDFACVMGGAETGKTTLLEVASGMARPDGGHVIFDGRDIAAMNEAQLVQLRRFDIACVWNQSMPTVVSESVIQHVALPLWSAGVGVRRARREAAKMIERVGAADYADAPVPSLSTAQRTRVALAQACVRQPKLLVADELTDTLNLIERNALLGLLQSFVQDGITVLMTAADGHGAVGANRLFLLSDGQLQEPRQVVEGTQPAPPAGDVVPFPPRDERDGRAE